MGGSLQSARRHGLGHDLLDRAELSRRFPQFRVPDSWVGLLEEKAGFLRPERVIAAYAEAALRLGADLRGHEPVLEWSAERSGVTVHTPRGEYHAAHLVFCGGSWTSKLVMNLGVPLVVTRQVLGWVWPRTPALFEMGVLPVWATDNPDGTIHYGFPMHDGSPGFKIAHHGPGPATDPDRVNRDPQPADEQTFRPALARLLPEADGPLLALRTCLYTNSPDHHFILGPHPREPNVTIACGFSGHGFKFASVMGEALADLATKEKTELPVGFLGLERFARC